MAETRRSRSNYPNPFNPSTKFNFDLPTAANVSLIVYDVLGREVAALVNGHHEAGYHSVTWSATNQPGSASASGMYFARFVVTDAMGQREIYKSEQASTHQIAPLCPHLSGFFGHTSLSI